MPATLLADPYADTAVSFEPGLYTDDSDGTEAVGAPQLPTSCNTSGAGYTSLGRYGNVTLMFMDNYVLDWSGNDFRVYEIGRNNCGACCNDESVLIEVSRDGINFVNLGEFPGATFEVDISPSDLSQISYVRISDIDGGGVSPIAGADIDAIEAINNKEMYTATANAQAATYGSDSLTGSGMSNEFILICIPVGAVIFFRFLLRKR